MIDFYPVIFSEKLNTVDFALGVSFVGPGQNRMMVTHYWLQEMFQDKLILIRIIIICNCFFKKA